MFNSTGLFMGKELSVNQIGAGRLTAAIATLEELHTDPDQSGSVRAGAAKAIISAHISYSAQPVQSAKSAGEMTLAELEQQIAETKARLKVVNPQ